MLSMLIINKFFQKIYILTRVIVLPNEFVTITKKHIKYAFYKTDCSLKDTQTLIFVKIKQKQKNKDEVVTGINLLSGYSR